MSDTAADPLARKPFGQDRALPCRPSPSAARRWGTCPTPSATRSPKRTPWPPSSPPSTAPSPTSTPPPSTATARASAASAWPCANAAASPPTPSLQTKAGPRPQDERLFRRDGQAPHGALAASCSASTASRSSICTIRSGRRSRRRWRRAGPSTSCSSSRSRASSGTSASPAGRFRVQMQYVETGLFDALIHHNRYTLLNRSAEPLIEAAVARGMAVLNAAPYGSGMLVKGPDAYPRYAYQQALAGNDRARAPVRRHRRPLRRAAGRGCPPVLDARSAHDRHHRRHEPPERIADTIRYLTTPIPDALWEEIAAIPYDTERSRGKPLQVGRDERAALLIRCSSGYVGVAIN